MAFPFYGCKVRSFLFSACIVKGEDSWKRERFRRSLSRNGTPFGNGEEAGLGARRFGGEHGSLNS